MTQDALKEVQALFDSLERDSAKLLDMLGTGSFQAPIKGTDRYVVAGTLKAIADVLPNTPAGSDTGIDLDKLTAVARAIWNIRREDEDRCDMELEDMGEDHSVWKEAEAALIALASRAAPAQTGLDEPIEVMAKRMYEAQRHSLPRPEMTWEEQSQMAKDYWIAGARNTIAQPTAVLDERALNNADLDYLLEYITVPAARAAAQRKVAELRAAQQASTSASAEPVAWLIERRDRRTGKLVHYASTPTEAMAEQYIADVHRSNDEVTLYSRPVYAATVQAAQPALPADCQFAWFHRLSEFGPWVECNPSAPGAVRFLAAPGAAQTTDARDAAGVTALCTWTLDDEENGIWQSSCGEAWSFVDGGPAENRVSYCHNCGKAVDIRTPQPNAEDSASQDAIQRETGGQS